MNDTIATISTALGVGAISIIRVSGPESIEIVNKIFSKNLSKIETHTINYGYIKDGENIIDEVLVSLMKAPKTYTREDLIEINCHGGIATTNKILELLIEKGCRLAEPGEFTKRAFLNGRIDLVQAEAVNSLLNANTDISRQQAINELKGDNSNLIKELREKLIQMISNIEVNIDYPEYEDIEELTNSKILPKLKDYVSNLETIISKSKEGRIIKEGINVALIGKPNVGKSSLLNTLLEEEKAIVTNIAGTTRDIVEGQINISGVVFNLIDTAGIRNTDNVIEQIGVEKSKKVIKDCNLILLIFNNNDVLTKEDMEIFDYVKQTDKPIIIIINKVDLETKLNKECLSKEYKTVEISTKTKEGINDLKAAIKEIFNLEKIITDDIKYSFNSRIIGLLEKSKNKIIAAIDAINNNYPVDIVELEIKSAWEILGEIIGETYTEELLDNLFSRFCLGK
jgi:tRNA modification GTPase